MKNAFEALKVMIFMWRKSILDGEHFGRRAFEDEELQTLMNEDPYQTQKQLAETLNCAQSVISNRLKALEKIYKEGKLIYKEGKWVPYELKRH